MKKFLVFLFVLTLPVSAGNEPITEEGNRAAEYEDIYQTLDEYDRSFKLHNKRQRGMTWVAWGVSVAGTGVATAMVADLDKTLTLGISATGVILAATGCYLVFKNRE